MGEYRHQVVQAVAWKIISELFRRHHQRYELRVMELHPGGGMYDCLSLFSAVRGFPGESLCDFNLISGKINVWRKTGNKVLETTGWTENNFVESFLTARDPITVVDIIEKAIGLPSVKEATLAQSSSAVLVSRLVSTLASRFLLERRNCEFRCAWFDSSGEPSGVREWIELFPSILQHCISSDSKDLMRVASRYWVMKVSESADMEQIRMAIDFAGKVYLTKDVDMPVDIYMKYKSGVALDEITLELLRK